MELRKRFLLTSFAESVSIVTPDRQDEPTLHSEVHMAAEPARMRTERLLNQWSAVSNHNAPLERFLAGHTAAMHRLFDFDDATISDALTGAALTSFLSDVRIQSFAVWRRLREDAHGVSVEDWVNRWLIPVTSTSELTSLARSAPKIPDASIIGVRARDAASLYAAGGLYTQALGMPRASDDDVRLSRDFVLAAIREAIMTARREGLLDDREPGRLLVAIRPDRPVPPVGPSVLHEQLTTQGVGWWHGGN